MKKLLLLLLFPLYVWGQTTDVNLKAVQIDPKIRNITTASGITKGNVSDVLQAIVDSKISRIEAVTTGGSINAYTATVSWATAYDTNMEITLFVGTANSGASTLNVNGYGVKSVLLQSGSALSGNELKGFVKVLYNGTAFQILGGSGGGGGGVSSVSGTANRVTSTGGSTPVLDISATFEALLGKVVSPLSQFAATTSSQLAGVISDETGSGSLVFNTSPTLVTPALGVPATGDFSTGTFTWPTFNQNTTGSAAKWTTARTFAITGDVTYSQSVDGSANVTGAGTLATVNSNVGSFGSATQSPTYTVNGKGLLTAASNVTITPAVGSITGFGTGVGTALVTNVGSAGSFITNGGAAGTFASGVATNLTGLPPTTGIVGWPANSSGVLTNNGSGTLSWAAAGGGGTVTSVALSLPSFITVSGSPVSTSGTLTGTLANQNNGTFFLGPLPTSYSGVTPTSSTPSVRTLDDVDMPTQNKVKANIYGSAPYFFSDSYGLSQQATSTNYGYVNRLGNLYNLITTNNLSISGKGVVALTIASYGNINTNTLGNSAPCLSMIGFNDLRRGGSAAATISKIQAGHRAMICNCLLKFGIAASAATNTGTWSNYSVANLTAKAVNLGGNARQSSTATDNISYTTTIASDNIVIGTYGSDGSTYNWGRFTYSIDGNVLGTYTPNGVGDLQNDGTTDNGQVPDAIFISGLANTTHTVLLTLLDAKTTIIDYIGFLQPAGAAPPFLVGSPPRMDATGYATSPANATDAVITAGKNAIKTVVQSFLSYQVIFVDNDLTGDISSGLGADHIHANDLGYNYITQAFAKSLSPSEAITFKQKWGSTGVPSFIEGTTVGLRFGSNYDPNDGTFYNSGTGAVRVDFVTGAADGHIDFYTTVNNGAVTKSLTASTLSLAQTVSSNNTVTVQSGNSNTGTSAVASVIASADVAVARMQAQSSGYTTVGGYNAKDVVFRGTGSANRVVIASDDASSGGMFFAVGNLTSSTAAYRMNINSSGNIYLGNGTTTASALLHNVQAALSSAWVPVSIFTPGAHTSMTTTVEFPDNIWNGSVHTWAAGTIATQRFNWFKASSIVTGTGTNVYTLYADAPSSGTNPYALGLAGNLALTTAGNYIAIKEGSNAFMGQTTLVSGTKAVSISGLTTSDRAIVTLVTPSGVTLTTTYQAVCTSGTLTLQANVAAGTINTADGSTLNYIIFRPTP